MTTLRFSKKKGKVVSPKNWKNPYNSKFWKCLVIVIRSNNEAQYLKNVQAVSNQLKYSLYEI